MVSKRKPSEKKVIKNLRFEIDVPTWNDFYFAGSLLGLSKKHNILKELIKIAKELNK